MWLTGGPGCSSEIATYFENGPFGVKDKTVHKNENSWNNVANLLYVDNPIGTGFSQAAITDYDTKESEIAAHMHQFVQGWLEQNPEFKGRDFYITGESYAGHYIPAISAYFVSHGKDLDIHFKGLGIGNGWVDPYVQYPQYAEFAHDNKLIGDT